MKGFIVLTSYLGNEKLVRVDEISNATREPKEESHGERTLIEYTSSRFGNYVRETPSEIHAKIKAAEQPIQGGNIIINGITSDPPDSLTMKIKESFERQQERFIKNNPAIEPRQNIYYRTSDRVPTAEDADADGFCLVSDDAKEWLIRDLKYAPTWEFWAPVPKVEVRP